MYKQFENFKYVGELAGESPVGRGVKIDSEGLACFRSLGWMHREKGNFISIFPNGGFKIGEYDGEVFGEVGSKYTAYYPDGKTERVGKCTLF